MVGQLVASDEAQPPLEAAGCSDLLCGVKGFSFGIEARAIDSRPELKHLCRHVLSHPTLRFLPPSGRCDHGATCRLRSFLTSALPWIFTFLFLSDPSKQRLQAGVLVWRAAGSAASAGVCSRQTHELGVGPDHPRDGAAEEVALGRRDLVNVLLVFRSGPPR